MCIYAAAVAATLTKAIVGEAIELKNNVIELMRERAIYGESAPQRSCLIEDL